MTVKIGSKIYMKSLVLLLSLLSIPAIAITTYTVKSGDSLWRIANKYNISGIPSKDMIKAIKGINAKENPSINDNVVNIKQKLLIPSTKSEVEDGLKLYTLHHTQYLPQSQPAAVPTQPVPTIIAKSTDKQVENIVQTPESKPLLSESTPIENNNTQINNSNGVVVPHPIAEESNNKIIPSQTNQVNTGAKNDHSKWFVLLLIIIVVLLMWRRRHKRKLQLPQQDTRLIKDQFYAKNADSDLKTDNSISQSINATHRKISTKKKSKDELEQLLSKADTLIEAHDITQAKAILQEALNHDSKNLNIRIKILIAYAAAGDEISFNSERDYLASNLLPYDDNRWQEINALYNKHFGIN